MPPDEGTALNLIVTQNLVFLSTAEHTYAVSLESHQPVWTFLKGGQLALSANGVLYIAVSVASEWETGSSALFAVNVR